MQENVQLSHVSDPEKELVLPLKVFPTDTVFPPMVQVGAAVGEGVGGGGVGFGVG